MTAETPSLLTRLSTQRRQWQRRFDERTPRERLALIIAGLAAALALGDALWISPGLAALQAARLRAQTAQTARNGSLADLQRMQTVDNARGQQVQTELGTWRQRVRDSDAALRTHEDTLIGPDRMVELLDHVLARHGSLRLRDMRSLGRSDLLAATAAGQASPGGIATQQPMTPAAAAAAAAALATFAGASAPGAGGIAANLPAAGGANAAPSLYRHGVEITLEGSFGELLSYLRTLEAMPQHVLWGGLRMKTTQHPTTVMTLRLYTLSRDRTWLEI